LTRDERHAQSWSYYKLDSVGSGGDPDVTPLWCAALLGHQRGETRNADSSTAFNPPGS